MDSELIQPTATLLAAVIGNQSAYGEPAQVTNSFVNLYRALEEAKRRIRDEDAKASPAQVGA